MAAEEAVSLLRVAERSVPASTHLAICHGDFCAENIVRDAEGRFYVADNETLAVDACEYESRATWYRWPMTKSQRAAYVEGYGQSREIMNFDAHLLHFAVVVLAESAAYLKRGFTPPAPACHCVACAPCCRARPVTLQHDLAEAGSSPFVAADLCQQGLALLGRRRSVPTELERG